MAFERNHRFSAIWTGTVVGFFEPTCSQTESAVLKKFLVWRVLAILQVDALLFVLFFNKRLLSQVGFEPTPPKRLRPERSALDQLGHRDTICRSGGSLSTCCLPPGKEWQKIGGSAGNRTRVSRTLSDYSATRPLSMHMLAGWLMCPKNLNRAGVCQMQKNKHSRWDSNPQPLP